MDPKKVLMKDKVPVSPYIGAIGKSFGRNTGRVYYYRVGQLTFPPPPSLAGVQLDLPAKGFFKGGGPTFSLSRLGGGGG